ncbi:hypothetical protein BH18ACT1_BH18ACT1_15320 [soil metagenome]
MHHALYLPPFGELADPRVLVDLAVTAEEVGWDGIFLWDHVLRPPSSPPEVGDTWVTLSAMAAATSRLRLGPMVTPLARRRPQKVARESVALDHLAAGRLTLGLGLGVDTGGELARFGELTDAKERGDALDEAVELLTALWSGEEVHHAGPRYVADGVRFRPVPLQSPRIPLWFAARGSATRPVRRAARFDGIFPIEVDDTQLAHTVDLVVAERGDLEGFDVAVLGIPGIDVDALAARGATWVLWSYLPGESAAEVRAGIDACPGAEAG